VRQWRRDAVDIDAFAAEPLAGIRPGVDASRYAASWQCRLLKLELQSELEAAPVVQSIGDLAESRGSEDRIRTVKLWGVKKIDRFGAERDPPVRVQGPGAREGNVHIPDAAAAEGIEAQQIRRVENAAIGSQKFLHIFTKSSGCGVNLY
jgi:hypothetical protein